MLVDFGFSYLFAKEFLLFIASLEVAKGYFSNKLVSCHQEIPSDALCPLCVYGNRPSSREFRNAWYLENSYNFHDD